MRDVWKIAKWEITRNLTNKQFIIGLLLTPLMMALFGGVPILLEKWNQPAIITYYVVDELDDLSSIQELLPQNIHLKEATDVYTVAKTVQETKASGFFHLTSAFLATGEVDLVYNDRNSGGLASIERALTAFLFRRHAHAKCPPGKMRPHIRGSLILHSPRQTYARKDLQSASNSQGLVVMLPMLSFLFLGPVISNPDGVIALFASLFPFTSPAMMMLRSGLTVVPRWQLLVSGSLLVLTTWATIMMAAKVFRIGMLMYGKNATMQEIFKWLRYKEN